MSLAMLLAGLGSPGTRSVALLSNKAYWPLLEMPIAKESPLPPPVPARLTLTRGGDVIGAVAEINIELGRNQNGNRVGVGGEHQIIGRAAEEDITSVGTDDRRPGVAVGVTAAAQRRIRLRNQLRGIRLEKRKPKEAMIATIRSR